MMRKILPALLCAVLLLGSAAAPAGPAPAGAEETAEPLRVTFVDVGKGDCILLSRGGSYVMIDTGHAETADKAVAAIRQAGAERLDALIITHYDKDHTGGADAILRSFPVDRIYLPGYEGDGKAYSTLSYRLWSMGLTAEKVTADTSFTFAGVQTEIFASPLAFVPGEGKEEGNDNDVSLVIAVRYGADSLLFPGDIEREGIAAFLAAGHGTFDVVKMPHHGQNEKNTDDFIAQTRMKIAVITDGEEEPVKKKVIKLLQAAGAEIYTSAADGDITVVCGGNGTYEVITER